MQQKAQCEFKLGQIAEHADDFASAIRFYKAALALEPVDPGLWYFNVSGVYR